MITIFLIYKNHNSHTDRNGQIAVPVDELDYAATGTERGKR